MKGLSVSEPWFLSMVIALGIAIVVRYVSNFLYIPPELCGGLYMSLDGSTLFIASWSPAAYKVLINGSQVWPCPKCVEHGSLTVPLNWSFAEVEVLRRDVRRLFYVVRLSNGAYVFAWDGKKAKSVCIP